VKFRTQSGERERFVQMLLDVTAHGFHCLRRGIGARSLWLAAQAGTIAGFFCLSGFSEESHILAAWAPGRARRPAINTGRGYGKNKLAILFRVAAQHGVPLHVLFVLVAALVAGHFYGVNLVEYRIGRHDVESLSQQSSTDHPDLAVKPIFLRYAGASTAQDLGQFPVAGSQFAAMLMKNDSDPIATSPEIVATYLDHELALDASHRVKDWERAMPVSFASDWQGKNADPGRETQVRVLWSRQYLYLRFECRYRALFTFEDSDPNGRRNHLWDRDVAEAFLQPDPSRERFYREFEVSPNGMWIDLDIFPGGLADLKSGLQRSVFIDEKTQVWTAELAIPMKSLTANFDSSAIWRANFYRVEGQKEPRTYLAWQPTKTPQPNFHVPSAFGELRFAGGVPH